MKAISLFACAGIGELRLNEIGVEVIAANEINGNRAKCYESFYPNSKMIVGDIKDEKVKGELKKYIKKDVNILIATPPCQGLSSLGKNKKQDQFINDQRNYLIFHIIELIDSGDFNYVLIENVPIFLKMLFPYDKSYHNLDYILRHKYSKKYEIHIDVLNVGEYGIPQSRPRAIIRIFKKGLIWNLPEKTKPVTLRESIGYLPSLEPGQKSNIELHSSKSINSRYELALRHTPTGESAINNKVYYPKKDNGERIKGFHNTFKRMKWDNTCPARTTYCGNVNSHNNVHPGKKNKDGTYSDARPLTLLETYLVSSIPDNIRFPGWCSDTFINTMIGEGVPPLFMNKILSGIKQTDDSQDRKR